MAGLVPAIHTFGSRGEIRYGGPVDARIKSGHDGACSALQRLTTRRHEVDFIRYQNRIGSGPRGCAQRLTGALRVKDKKPDLGLFGAPQRAPQALLLDNVVAGEQPGGVGKDNGVALEVDRDLDDVPRGAGDRRGDNRVAFCYPVEKTRFSGIWRADDRNHDAVSQPFTAMPVGEVTLDFGGELFRLTKDTILDLG